LTGTHSDAIQHTWYDTILNKNFWRSTLTKHGARIPRELGEWNGSSLDVKVADSIHKSDLVIKRNDMFMGIGDSFWNLGQDFHSEAEVVHKLEKEYEGTEVLVLELVRPKKSLGVHSLDILTLRTTDGNAKVVSVILWTDCTTSSSHSTRAGYIVDVESETLIAPAGWYAIAFAKMEAPLIGTKFPGVKKACELCVEAHREIEYKWLTAVGWDLMVMENDELVFFEGNFAGARTPRRMMLSLANFTEFIYNFFWPFGGPSNTIQPGWQLF